MNENEILDGAKKVIAAISNASDAEKLAILNTAAKTMESIMTAKAMGMNIANLLRGG